MENQNRESVATPVADLLVGDEASELAARNQQAAALLGGWLEEDNAYDAEIWPLMEQELAELRTRVGDSSVKVFLDTNLVRRLCHPTIDLSRFVPTIRWNEV